MLPGELTDHLLAVFCSHIFQFSFYMSVQDFKRSVHLPPSDPDSLPPCLHSAIFLVACHFSPRPLSDLEAIFLQRTHRLLSQATVSGDRPMDICMAAVLFSRYCFYTNRPDLGVCYTSSALTFAIGCSLHQVSLQSSKLNPNTGPLPPSRSEEETLRRIRMWNSLYILDRGSSWTNGLAPYLSDEDITTPWSINSLSSGSRLQQIRTSPPSPTITSLFAADSPTLTVQRGDTALSIRARSVALHDRSNRFKLSLTARSGTRSIPSTHNCHNSSIPYRASRPSQVLGRLIHTGKMMKLFI
ncbi:hypothetical protein BS47DRAFT_140471 [Hydnum rufescens UP504]|uniref:Xylanolytic transcriptional activator regulatory domain-containing protein n=1 Tax=Hydnum rufescens UP504 TaxID=1448309 RepID=A0A9P6AQ88_9AGAM|nr:hypothetical protein BS47DRAFT_140471 [Hydnum rufescens UP504]